MSEQSGRVPPQALEIEKQVLGEMLCDANGVMNVLSIISANDFYKPAHNKIFSAIVKLFERSEPADSITVVEQLRSDGHLDEIGGPLYIADLSMMATSSANAEYHAKIILEKSILRQMIATGNEMVSKAFGEQDDALELLGKAEDDILKISGITRKDLPKGISELTNTVVDDIERMRSGEKKSFGISSGFKKLDEYTGGFEPANLYIIAARPSIGKTALALSMMLNIKEPSALFSLEMGNEAITLRLLSQESKISFYRLRNGYVHTDSDGIDLARAHQRLDSKKIFIDESSSATIYDIKTKTKRMIQDADIKIIFIDYLQLMSAPKSDRIQNRDQEIGYITKSLKQLSKDLHIPVVLLSQLSRGVESRSDKRPVLSDLRESGNIEQDADVVIFPHRDKMDENVRPEMIIGKNRNGQTGAFDVTFIGDIMRFQDYEAPSFNDKW